eukprot:TRINITY_DN6685_c0_g1_i1.p1 TRINITY_DN6685_c0_g1~~TRINITY_DN6685_c0_g1_i1.p1  ORF type:complete len:363 (+),score=60.35 TRINITY_DN6685_c0_g1_i1:114-1202(+)
MTGKVSLRGRLLLGTLPLVKLHLRILSRVYLKSKQSILLQGERLLLDYGSLMFYSLFRKPGFISHTNIMANGVPTRWIQNKHASSTQAILYLHGGAFIIGSAKVYTHFCTMMSEQSNCDVYVAEYRVAPEHRFPTQLCDSLDVYRYLLQKYPSQNIAICGDSAGGNLVFSTFLKMLEMKLPLPGCLVAMSPWLNLLAKHPEPPEHRHEQEKEILKSKDYIIDSKKQMKKEGRQSYQAVGKDPLIPYELMKQVVELYVDEKDVRNPLASPVFASKAMLSRLPPTLIHVGGTEILLGENIHFYEATQAARARSVQLHIFPNMVHVFQIFAPLLPEAKDALAEISFFIREQLSIARQQKKQISKS